MIVKALLAVILGLIAYFVANMFLDYTLSVLIGIAVGLIVFFGDRVN